MCLPVPSIYSSARTELAKLLIYGLFRKIRVLAQDGVLAFFGDATREDGRVDIDDLVADLVEELASDARALVLPPLSVGEMTLRLYGALSYSQNSARDLRCALSGA